MDPQTQIPEPLPPQQQPVPEVPPTQYSYAQVIPEYESAPPPEYRPPTPLISLVITMFLVLSSTGSMIAGADTGTYSQVVVTSDSLTPEKIDQASEGADALATASPTPTPTPTDTPVPSNTSTPTTAAAPVPKKSTTSTPAPTHSTSPSPAPSQAPTKPASGYYDGTYSSSARYSVPGSTESIGVTVVLSNGVVSDVSITQNPTNGTSGSYQSRFASGYKSLVVGKNISSLSLGRVSGASLTPNGFNSAIASIRSKAAA